VQGWASEKKREEGGMTGGGKIKSKTNVFISLRYIFIHYIDINSEFLTG
jgi:hypothetical protein